MAKQSSEKSNKDILGELGIEAEPARKQSRTPREERIISGFEEIQQFVEKNGHPPAHGEDNDIFERLYATRLDQIRSSDECRDLVKVQDHQGLLDGAVCIAEEPEEYSNDEELLAELGVEAPKEGDVTFLKHIKPRAEVKAAEDIAARKPCEDFEKFSPVFETVHTDLKSGGREAKILTKNPQINQGDLFILYGQIVYVAKVSDERIHGFDSNDYRLRVIYDNGTESDLLMRSLQRVLDKDERGRRIVDLGAGPLFDDITDEEDLASGTIYVLRSQSNLPVIQKNRDVIHKIGVTGGSVENRIAKAKLDPTYLMADVEIVATYELFNINRTKLEKLLHKFFDSANLDIQINDRFGNLVHPREWFLVPLFIIDDVVEKIKDGTISKYSYNEKSATLTVEKRTS